MNVRVGRNLFSPPDECERYTQRPLPPYRYIPFQGRETLPHPRNDPRGHSYSAEDEFLGQFSADDWASCEAYLYGVDLFNYGFWWEAHESWEAVWLAAGDRSTRCGIFVQGLIQLAAAQLKRVIGSSRGAQSLTAAGCEKLATAEGIFLGIDVTQLICEAQHCLHENNGRFPHIALHMPT